MILIKGLIFYAATGVGLYLVTKPLIHRKPNRLTTSLLFTIGFVFRPIIISLIAVETWELNHRVLRMLEKKNNRKYTKDEKKVLLEIINRTGGAL